MAEQNIMQAEKLVTVVSEDQERRLREENREKLRTRIQPEEMKKGLPVEEELELELDNEEDLRNSSSSSEDSSEPEESFSVSLSDLIPNKDEVWIEYSEKANPYIKFELLVKYVSQQVSTKISLALGGRRGGAQPDPKKVREVYARYIFLNYRGIIDKATREPLKNSLLIRMELLKNNSILQFVVDSATDASIFVDTGTPEDEKK